MALRMLGIGDLGAVGAPGDVVKTLALGSCVAVVILDPKTKTVGMVHVALPDSTLNPQKRVEKPGDFADSAIPALVEEMRRGGASGKLPDMYVKLIGGANVMDANNTFDIGKRNVLAIKKILWKFGTGPVAEEVGGHISRTVAVDVDTGTTMISSPGKENWSI